MRPCLHTPAAAAAALVLLALGLPAAAGAQLADSLARRVDAVFARHASPDAPGCAVGVDRGGAIGYRNGYGSADLETGTPIRPGTIFEAGSVSKQFTAGAVVLLALEGRLDLDDDIRTHLPEVPDFGETIRIRHLLHHTSGLRSQWPLLTIAGRPPTEVVHTTDEILWLVSRQRELNFRPGDEYLYNNTAYTLMGVIVERVTGQSLADFTRDRFFAPLGMKDTQWRDDHRRIVPGRAKAYGERDGAYGTLMPFTNVYGNGGLLTTVGDLLLWTANLETGAVGGPAWVEAMHARGRLNDGTEIDYAMGINVSTYRGEREVQHGGATAGYRAFLTRFPDHRLAVAVLCNVTSADAGGLARAVAGVFIGDRFRTPAPPAFVTVPAEALEARAGVYRNPITDEALVLAARDGRLHVGPGGGEFRPVGTDRFANAAGTTELRFADAGGAVTLEVRGGGRPVQWVRMEPFRPGPAELREYEGRYHSPELDVSYDVAVRDGRLAQRLRWEPWQALEPVYADAFRAGGLIIRFERDAAGRIDGYRVFAGRVRHLRFERQ
jgi:CubicO group peptidase (beta-lactamase class C family)